jgi:transcriptional regulator with PAS, ATPase and Fis domain
MGRDYAKYGKLIGQTPAIQKLRRSISQAARTSINVMITGETGTGKELVARSIHVESRRRSARFVPVMCNAYPETLIESELFGYAEGAFTNAKRSKPGMFEMANEGTLFLDEIADVPLTVQAKLLRALEHLTITRVGSVEPRIIDTRLIAATNKNLELLVGRGQFREDLFYRLNVFSIIVPPLRKRTEDIPLIVDYLLPLYSERHGIGTPAMTEEAMQILCRYSWPGNVRQLQNVIESTIVCLEGEMITPNDLPSYVVDRSRRVDLTELERSERDRLSDLLMKTRGNISETARRLGITRQSVYRRMTKYRIDRHEYLSG